MPSVPTLPDLRLEGPEGYEMQLEIDGESTGEVTASEGHNMTVVQDDGLHLSLSTLDALLSDSTSVGVDYLTSFDSPTMHPVSGSPLTDGIASLNLDPIFLTPPSLLFDTELVTQLPSPSPHTDSSLPASFLFDDSIVQPTSPNNDTAVVFSTEPAPFSPPPISSQESSPGIRIYIETSDLPQQFSPTSATSPWNSHSGALSPGSSDISALSSPFLFPSPVTPEDGSFYLPSNSLLSDPDASGPRGETMRGRTYARDKSTGRHSNRHSPYPMASRSNSQASGSYTSEDHGVDGGHIVHERLKSRPRSPGIIPRSRNWSGPTREPPHSQPFSSVFLASGSCPQPRHVSTGTHPMILALFQNDFDASPAEVLARSRATATFDDNHEEDAPDPPPPSPITRPQVGSAAIFEAAINRRKTDAKYTCDLPGCKATFTARHNLQNHINSHLGIRDFKCVHCGRDFGTAHVRWRHLKTCKGKNTRKSPSPPQS